MKLTDAAFRQMRYLANPRKRLKNQASPDTSRATVQRGYRGDLAMRQRNRYLS
jgi:hypothetical protein